MESNAGMCAWGAAWTQHKQSDSICINTTQFNGYCCYSIDEFDDAEQKTTKVAAIWSWHRSQSLPANSMARQLASNHTNLIFLNYILVRAPLQIPKVEETKSIISWMNQLRLKSRQIPTAIFHFPITHIQSVVLCGPRLSFCVLLWR